MKRFLILFISLFLLLFSCVANGNTEEMNSYSSEENTISKEGKELLLIERGDEHFLADLYDNRGANAFKDLLREEGSITIRMSDYGDFEKVGSLGSSLETANRSMNTEPGDVVLYQGNSICIYYGYNSWSFTPLAKIRDVNNLRQRLGNGTVNITFSLREEH